MLQWNWPRRGHIANRILELKVGLLYVKLTQIKTLMDFGGGFEIFTHSKFQFHVLYNFRVRAGQKVIFSPNFTILLA